MLIVPIAHVMSRDIREKAWFPGLQSVRALLAFMGLAQPESDIRMNLCNYRAHRFCPLASLFFKIFPYLLSTQEQAGIGWDMCQAVGQGLDAYFMTRSIPQLYMLGASIIAILQRRKLRLRNLPRSGNNCVAEPEFKTKLSDTAITLYLALIIRVCFFFFF